MVGLMAALAGMGKTTILDTIAEHWAMNGQNVVLVHLEDSLEYKLDRRLSQWSKVPLAHIEDGNYAPGEWDKVQEAQAALARAVPTLHYFEGAGMNMYEIVTELAFRVQEGTCNAVVFDYLDKTAASRNQGQLFGSNIWERQANDLELLKTFAEKNKVVVFTANQGNKSMGATGRAERSGIQGSGAKSQKPQLVMLLERERAGEEGILDDDGEVLALPWHYSPIMEWTIEKQNRGASGSFRQYLDGQTFNVYDIDVQRIPLEY
jgi:replicative DNA helicase